MRHTQHFVPFLLLGLAYLAAAKPISGQGSSFLLEGQGWTALVWNIDANREELGWDAVMINHLYGTNHLNRYGFSYALFDTDNREYSLSNLVQPPQQVGPSEVNLIYEEPPQNPKFRIEVNAKLEGGFFGHKEQDFIYSVEIRNISREPITLDWYAYADPDLLPAVEEGLLQEFSPNSFLMSFEGITSHKTANFRGSDLDNTHTFQNWFLGETPTLNQWLINEQRDLLTNLETPLETFDLSASSRQRRTFKPSAVARWRYAFWAKRRTTPIKG